MKTLVKTTFLNMLGMSLALTCLLFTTPVHAEEKQQHTVTTQEVTYDMYARGHQHLPNDGKERICT